MSLSELYHSTLNHPDMVHDEAQEQAIALLEALSLKLTSPKPKGIVSWLNKNTPFKSRQPNPIKGLYLWGGVGRGKTWLMNLFYEQLPIQQKTRVHFHHFMLDIHDKLGSLNKQSKRKKNPLQIIAKELASDFRVLCIDEFIVTNITDAMILSELLHELFALDVSLVATSNRIPDDLYLNGLQRDRFLPAIELIKTHTNVFHLSSGVDHRAALLEHNDIYYHPITDKTPDLIEERIQEIAITPLIPNKVIRVLNRDIETILCSDETVWFEFEVICTSPRAAQDYIALAQQYSTIIINNIPLMGEYDDDRARRFIYLIDELYDKNVKVIASAYAEPEELYSGNMLEFAFHRTSSRLIEMRSHQYLSKSHKPF